MTTMTPHSIAVTFTTATADMPKISTITAKPSYTTIKKFQDKINENAMTIPSPQTDLGHLALVLKPDDFTSANEDTAFVTPVSPGDAPIDPTTNIMSSAGATRSTRGATAEDDAAINMLPFTAPEAIRQFKQDKLNHSVYVQANIALKNQIINAVDDKYISAKKNPVTLYAKVTPLTLLTHLWDTYGTIDQADQTANEARMRKDWNPPNPIEELYEQLVEGQVFASKGHETISDGQLIRWGYEIVLKTGLFNRDCEKWRKKQEVDKTWENFKTHFSIAEDDREKNQTNADAGYSANQMEQIIQQQVQAEMAALLNSLPQVDEEPPPLAKETPAANATVTLDAIAKLIDAKLKTARINQTPTVKPPPQGTIDGIPVTYCWSHGVTANLYHNSTTCRRCKAGHKKEATLNNRMGGSDVRNKKREA